MHACIVDKLTFGQINRDNNDWVLPWCISLTTLIRFIVDWTGSFAYSWIGTAALLFALFLHGKEWGDQTTEWRKRGIEVEGEVAVVTGAASGIGKAAVERFTEEGH